MDMDVGCSSSSAPVPLVRLPRIKPQRQNLFVRPIDKSGTTAVIPEGSGCKRARVSVEPLHSPSAAESSDFSDSLGVKQGCGGECPIHILTHLFHSRKLSQLEVQMKGTDKKEQQRQLLLSSTFKTSVKLAKPHKQSKSTAEISRKFAERKQQKAEHKERQDDRETKRLFNEIVSNTFLINNCCLKNLNVSELITPVFRHVMKTQRLSKAARNDRLMAHFKDNGLNHFRIMNQKCCKTCFLNFNDIMPRTFFRAQNKFREGDTQYQRRTRRKRRHSSRYMHSKAWVQHYVKLMGEYMPYAFKVRVQFQSETEFWKFYKKSFERKYNQTPLSKSAFLDIITKLFGTAMHYPAYSKYARCDTCDGWDAKIAKAESELDKEVLRARRAKYHTDITDAERIEYERIQCRAVNDPENYCSMALDGYDTKKTQIPHRRRNAHKLDLLQKLCVPFIGTVVHAHAPGSMVHYFHGEYPKDSSVTATVLLDVIHEVMERRNYKKFKRIDIQLDNCSRENKNKVVLTMLGFLVKLGYADEIYVNFFKVGHTHNDVDQMFSVFAQNLCNRNINTIESLLRYAKHSYTHSTTGLLPLFRRLDKIPNWLLWCERHGPAINGVTNPHCFRLFKKSFVDQSVRLEVKKHMLEEVKFECYDGGVFLPGHLKPPNVSELRKLPFLDVTDMLDALTGTVAKFSKDIFRQADKESWSRVLQYLNEVKDNMCGTCQDWRVQMVEHKASKHFSKEVTSAKNTAYKAAYRGLIDHIAASDDHKHQGGFTWPFTRSDVAADEEEEEEEDEDEYDEDEFGVDAGQVPPALSDSKQVEEQVVAQADAKQIDEKINDEVQPGQSRVVDLASSLSESSSSDSGDELMTGVLRDDFEQLISIGQNNVRKARKKPLPDLEIGDYIAMIAPNNAPDGMPFPDSKSGDAERFWMGKLLSYDKKSKKQEAEVHWVGNTTHDVDKPMLLKWTDGDKDSVYSQHQKGVAHVDRIDKKSIVAWFNPKKLFKVTNKKLNFKLKLRPCNEIRRRMGCRKLV